jgi:8-oxo-dGTP pyrophosphatase MutT (NUDIX family)
MNDVDRFLGKLAEQVREAAQLPAYGPALYFWLGTQMSVEFWATLELLRAEWGHDRLDEEMKKAILASGRYKTGEDGEEPTARKQAVAVLIRNGIHFAAIRSNKRGKRIGLVAGKVEPGELRMQAAVRESLEETGLLLLGGVCLGEKYDGERSCSLILALKWEGELRSSDEGEAFWATREELVGSEGAYPEWNTWALEQLDDYDALHR